MIEVMGELLPAATIAGTGGSKSNEYEVDAVSYPVI